jgi:tRNA1(Val) A37 N6-methylase TrmN6
MMEALPDLPYSEDTLLGGKVKLRQKQYGYRAAIDPVLLAAAVPAGPGDSVLDIGCGAGAAALCLATRVEGCRVTGLEAQRELVRLANDNIMLNGLTSRVVAVSGDLLRPPPRLEPGSFGHVMANPPFLKAGSVTAPQDSGKAEASIEGEADLAAWIRFALMMVQPKGSLTFIHRADRMEQLLAQLAAARVGEIVVFPLWPGLERPAKRIILRARKGVATATRLMQGLVLHDAQGRYSAAAEAVLRGASALAF